MEVQDVNIKGAEKPIEVISTTPQDVKIVDSEKPIEVVNVASPDDTPINVKVVPGKERPRFITRADGSQSLEPTTTYQEDITKEGQRAINLIWERTQAMIAKSVVFSTMAAGIMLLLGKIFYPEKNLEMPITFAFAFGTVIGFYFGRTNHQKIGGISTDKQAGR